MNIGEESEAFVAEPMPDSTERTIDAPATEEGELVPAGVPASEAEREAVAP